TVRVGEQGRDAEHGCGSAGEPRASARCVCRGVVDHEEHDQPERLEVANALRQKELACEPDQHEERGQDERPPCSLRERREQHEPDGGGRELVDRGDVEQDDLDDQQRYEPEGENRRMSGSSWNLVDGPPLDYQTVTGSSTSCRSWVLAAACSA